MKQGRQHLQRVVKTRCESAPYNTSAVRDFFVPVMISSTLADSCCLVQTELARIASELARRFCIPDNAPDAELYHPLLGGLPPRRSQKAAKKAGIETIAIANFHYTDKIKAIDIQYKAADNDKGLQISAPSTGGDRRASLTQTFPTARSRSRQGRLVVSKYYTFD